MKHTIATVLTSITLATIASGQSAYPLHEAAAEGKLAVVKKLVSKTTVNAKNSGGATALHFAASEGQKDVAEFLVANGADVNIVAENPKEILLPKGGLEQLATANPNTRLELELKTVNFNLTPLHLAAANGHYEIAELLLAKGAKVNPADGHPGNTPLAHAALKGHIAVVRLLLMKGADVNAKNKVGQTSLALAVSNGHSDIATLLKEHGAKE